MDKIIIKDFYSTIKEVTVEEDVNFAGGWRVDYDGFKISLNIVEVIDFMEFKKKLNDIKK